MKKELCYFFVAVALISVTIESTQAQAQKKPYYLLNMLGNAKCPVGVALAGKNPINLFYGQKALELDKQDFPIKITPGCPDFALPPGETALTISNPGTSGPTCISIYYDGHLNPQDPRSAALIHSSDGYFPCPPTGS